jgi:methylenetetrahydrofolate dehydrogenase (NADP+) / methenyltetrahydrofolate cyclohydrolase
MDSKLLNGKKLSSKILENLKSNILSLKNKPGLGMIIVGNRKDSMTYVKMKKKACEKVGINSTIIELPENIKQEDLILEINK